MPSSKLSIACACLFAGVVACGTSAPHPATAPMPVPPEPPPRSETPVVSEEPRIVWDRLVIQEGIVRRTDLDARCGAGHWGFFMPTWFIDAATPAPAPAELGCVSPAQVAGERSADGASDRLGTAFCCPGERSALPPHTAGAPSCEQAARDAAGRIPVVVAEEPSGPFPHILNRGSFFEHCGVPSETGIDICVAVVEGDAIGVTIRTRPASAEYAECVAESTLRLTFPSNPRMDVARTRY